MKNKKAIARVFLTLLTLICVIFLWSCGTMAESNSHAEQITRDFVDELIENDLDGAYSVIKDCCTKDELNGIFPEMVSYVDGAESYEFKTVGMYLQTSNGSSYYSGTYRITTDNGRVCTLYTVIDLDSDTLYSIHINDNTQLVQTEEALGWLNIVMKVISAVFMGIGIWMLVDCIRRPLRHKALWIIFIVLVGILGGITVSVLAGGGSFNLSVNYGISILSGGITADLDRNALEFSLLIPLGTIVYFFCRKSLSRQELARRAAAQGPAGNAGGPGAVNGNYYQQNGNYNGYNGGYPNGNPNGYPNGYPNGNPNDSPNGFPNGNPNGYPGGYPNGYPNGNASNAGTNTSEGNNPSAQAPDSSEGSDNKEQ